MQINSGNVGVGTTTPYARHSVWGTDSASSKLAFNVVNNGSTTVFAVFDGGNAQLSGTLTQTSDARLKTNVQPLDASSSLAAIEALNPVTYQWIDPEKGSAQQLGFIAQHLPILPGLVSTTSPTALTPNGTLGLNYIGFIAPIVKAIQALSARLTSLEQTVAGFADHFTTKELTFTRATGDELDANTVKTKQLCAQKSDGTEVCLSGDQLAAALASGGAASATSPSENATTAPNTPPTITVNGDNPAIIHVGDTYSDLGATIEGPQADLNLGIKMFLNGTLVSNIVLDTSAVATDTIDYIVTDQSGLTATSTRTVIIEPPTATANDNTPPLVTSTTTTASTTQQ
jgi:hypothetical protein